MASDDTFTTIQQTLDAGWATTPIVYENEHHRLPGSPAAFVYVEVFGDFFDQTSIGAEPRTDNLWREGGQLYMHVMVKDGIGSSLARQYAKTLVGLFRGQEIDGVSFLDASIGHGEPGREFANYWAMTATVFWERDE